MCELPGADRFFGEGITTPEGVIDGNLLVPNSRRFEMSLRPSLTYQVGDDVTIGAELSVPVYTQPFAEGDRFISQPTGVLIRARLLF